MKAPKQHLALLIILLIGLSLLVTLPGCRHSDSRPPNHPILQQQGPPPTLPPFAVKGNSSDFRTIQFVPTLDTPLEGSINAIWCASFELAWRQLIDEVLKEPVKLVPEKPIVTRLNASPFSKSWLPDGNWFAVAGYVDEGILQRIKDGMKAFPDATPPDLSEYENTPFLVTYGYLRGDVVFDKPFLKEEGKLSFTSAGGQAQPVKAFGVLRDDFGQVEVRGQVEVLYSSTAGDSASDEFALDLSRATEPSQLVVACVKPEVTLGATLDALDAKISGWRPEKGQRELRDDDDLMVPTMGLSLLHSYQELLGLKLENPVKMQHNPVLRADQLVDFRLTRWGAQLSSYGAMVVGSAAISHGRKFVFDRPFLVYMKKRGEKTPYFAMWVADATFMYQGNNTSQAP